MKNPLRRLKDLKLSNVDFVPLGANPGAHITLVKENPLAAKVIDALTGRFGDTVVFHELADDGTVTYELDGTTHRVACTHGADGEVTLSEPTAVEEISDEELHVSDTATAELEQARQEAAEAAKAEAQAEIEKARADASAEVEELRKQLDEAKAAASEGADIRKELDETKAEIADLRKERREREFLAKAMEFDGLGKTEDMRDLLMEADEGLSEGANELLARLLRGAAEVAKQSDIFKQVSKDIGDGPETAAEKLAKLAKERHQADPSKSVEQHKLDVARENRELVREMAAERS